MILKREVDRKSIYLILLCLFFWFIHLIFDSENPTKLFHLTFFTIIIIISYHISIRDDINTQILINTILLLNLITSIITIQALNFDHNISRAFSKSNEESVALALRGIAGYGIVYFNACLIPLLLMRLKYHQTNKHIRKVVYIALCLTASVFLVIKAQYLIANLIVFFSIIFIAYKNFPKLRIVGIFSVALLLFFFSKPLIEGFESLIAGTRYISKFNYLLDDSTGENTGVISRVSKYSTSIKTIIEKPLLGSLKFNYNKIGSHSEILDIFAQFGLILGASFFFIFGKIFYQIHTSLSNSYRVFSITMFIAIFICALLNTIALEIALAVLFLSLIKVKNKPYGLQ